MKEFPSYDSDVPRNYYDCFGEKEWTRLSRNPAGELLYHVHIYVFRCHVRKEASALELGAGAGMFSKELVTLAGQLVVSDISEEQLAINRSKMTELGLENRIQDFLILDITDLKGVNSNQYDVVTCVGGVLNYTFDKEQAAIHEMLRVAKQRLWLHYNFLPVWDRPASNKTHVPPYVFVTEALEVCRSIRDVEALLNETDRGGGMLLFVADGKNHEFALFDCMCSQYFRRRQSNGWIVGTNHYCTCEDLTLTEADKEPLGTFSRFKRMEDLIQKLSATKTASNYSSHGILDMLFITQRYDSIRRA